MPLDQPRAWLQSLLDISGVGRFDPAWWLGEGALGLFPKVLEQRLLTQSGHALLPIEVERIPDALEVAVFERGDRRSAQRLQLDTRGAEPLISCLLVTRDRPQMAQRAILAFLRQSHRNRELIVVDHGHSVELQSWILARAEPSIRYLRPPREQSLGAIRNLSVAHAQGPLLAIWDDDDIHHPRRLQVQLTAIRELSVDACFLHRVNFWWPNRERAALSCHRLWEPTLMARREILPRYPLIARGEDTPVCELLAIRGRVALLDVPALYAYVVHGNNVSQHLEGHWNRAGHQYRGADYARWLRRLSEEIGDEHLPR